MANEYALLHVIQAAAGAIPGGAHKVGQLLTNEVKIRLSHPGTGIVYRSRMKNVGGKRTYVPGPNFHLHQASAPGEAPAVDTGAYRASWGFEVVTEPNMIVMRAGTPDEIGPWLEFGTSKMDARPHVRPAVAAVSAQIGPLLGQEIERAERDEARRRGGRG